MTPPDRIIPFVKASACGNDFLIVDGLYVPADIAGFSKRLCDRHYGVGADGVEWLFPAQDADIRARLFNADGSEAEISGNGTRCVAAYLCSEQTAEPASAEGKETFAIRTGAGIRICTLTSRSESWYEFEIAMGEPRVGDEFPVKLAFGEARGIPVSMGNPHYVVFVQEYAPGWQAEVDGRPAPVHTANMLFRAIVVPEGDHTVVLRYRPPAVIWGLAASAVSLVALGVMIVRTRRPTPEA